MKRKSLRTDELDYDLPPELIATRPVEPRDSARMMVVWRSRSGIEHGHVRDLPEYLASGDALVFNNTAVIPARLIGRRSDTAGRVEGLFLGEAKTDGTTTWRMMLKAGGRLKPGVQLEWLTHDQHPSGVGGRLERKDGSEWLVGLVGPKKTQEALAKVGWTPLPPYILHARGQNVEPDQLDRQWYQTVFADQSHGRSVAAPTAGLHFTPELLSRLAAKGVERIDVTLHVGPGTFKPIAAETLDQHRMHSESFEVSPQAVASLRQLRSSRSSKRIIAVGTTAVRTLESLPHPLPNPPPGSWEMYGPITGMTDLMIAPPYEFRLVDGMLTNFHLPRSTLMALVAAMLGEPGCISPAIERLKGVYREAIEQRYRFYSYGDAMLILP